MSSPFNLPNWFLFTTSTWKPLRKRLQGKYTFGYRNLNRIGHYRELNAFKTIRDFIGLLDANTSLLINEFATPYLLAPLEVPFSASESELKRIKGTPRFTEERYVIFQTQRVLFYKDHIDGFEFISQFHFVGNILMIVKQDILCTNDDRRKKLFELIGRKYNVVLPQTHEHATLRLTDLHGGVMLLRHGYRTEITYSNIMQEFAERLRKEEHITGEVMMQIERSSDRRIMFQI